MGRKGHGAESNLPTAQLTLQDQRLKFLPVQGPLSLPVGRRSQDSEGLFPPAHGDPTASCLHREVVCECGYPREKHPEEVTKPMAFQGKEWDLKTHVQEMATDAFGDIVFAGLGQKLGKVSSVPAALRAVTMQGTPGTVVQESLVRETWGTPGAEGQGGQGICRLLPGVPAVREPSEASAGLGTVAVRRGKEQAVRRALCYGHGLGWGWDGRVQA